MHRLIARAVPWAAPVGAALAQHSASSAMAESAAVRSDSAPIVRRESKPAPPGKQVPVHIGSRMCAFAGRTSWALSEFGGEEFLQLEVGIGADRPIWLAAVNPQNTVPVILDEAGRRVPGNSVALTNWLIERSGGDCADEAAQEVVRQFDKTALGALYALLRCTAPLGSPERARAQLRVENALGALEARFAARGGDGPYFLGDEVSLADIAIFSVLFRFQASLREFRNYDLVTSERTPRLARGLEASASRPAFQAVTPKPSEIVEFYASDATYNPNEKSPALDAWVSRLLAGLQTVP